MLSKIFIKVVLFIFIFLLLISVGICRGIRYDYIAEQEALRLFSQAEAMANVGRYESAIIQLTKLLDYYPGIYLSGDALLLCGDCYRALGRLNQAEAAYKRYLRKFKDKAKGYLGLVECYSDMRDFKKLAKVATKAAKLYPLTAEVGQIVDCVDQLIKNYPESKRLKRLQVILKRIIEIKKGK